mmetsp:Transcript_49294/g.91684  ORF Transcript_49294/g.91684 Transcript_49294/m.91684 type:complete len:263 (-) Transcript_49294:144-932(-)
MMKRLEGGQEADLVDVSIIKHFPGHGHFRGTVQSFDGDFFSVLYTDGDREELSPNELHNYFATSLPKGHRRRRRPLPKEQVAYPRLDPRVGSEYQVVVPDLKATTAEMDASALMVPQWPGLAASERQIAVESKIQRLKERFGCGDLGSKRNSAWLLHSPEEETLSALKQCDFDEDAAALQLSSLVASRPTRVWSQEECSQFTSLMIKHRKDFRAVQKEFEPELQMSEVLQYYYGVWKKGSRHYSVVKTLKKQVQQQNGIIRK